MTWIHPGRLTCPLKRDYSSRKYIFQPSFSGDMLVFRGCTVYIPPGGKGTSSTQEYEEDVLKGIWHVIHWQPYFLQETKNIPPGGKGTSLTQKCRLGWDTRDRTQEGISPFPVTRYGSILGSGYLNLHLRLPLANRENGHPKVPLEG